MLIHLDKEDFEEEIKTGKVLVDFYADWCGPCRLLAPILEEYSKEEQELKIIKVNVDNHEDIARKYGVMSIPTLILFQDGESIKENIGVLNKIDLQKFINDV